MAVKETVLGVLEDFMWDPEDLDNTLDDLSIDILSILPQGYSIRVAPIEDKVIIEVFNLSDHVEAAFMIDQSTEIKEL